mgnify:CR=1 FL=1
MGQKRFEWGKPRRSPTEDAIRRTVTNATILTASHPTRLPAVIRQQPRGNPSAEEFTLQTEDSARQRNSRRQGDQYDNENSAAVGDKPARHTRGNVTWIRGRSDQQDISPDDRRQTSDRRGQGVNVFTQRAADRAPALTTVGSGFMAQLIAQEIVPELSQQPGLMTDNGHEAYESSMERAEIHIDPFNAYAEHA